MSWIALGLSLFSLSLAVVNERNYRRRRRHPYTVYLTLWDRFRLWRQSLHEPKENT